LVPGTRDVVLAETQRGRDTEVQRHRDTEAQRHRGGTWDRINLAYADMHSMHSAIPYIPLLAALSDDVHIGIGNREYLDIGNRNREQGTGNMEQGIGNTST
jgi:hypothetical protein